MLSLLFYFYETFVVLHQQQERIWNIGFFFHIRQMHLLEYWQSNRDTLNAAYTRCAPVTCDDVVRPQKRAERERRDQLRAPGPQVPELSSNTSTWKFETMS